MVEGVTPAGYSLAHETLEAMRQAAVRMVRRGIRVEDIAAGMRLNRSTVFGWIRKHRQGGWKALASTKAPGARPKLRQAQLLKLLDMLHRPAVYYGFGSDLWS